MSNTPRGPPGLAVSGQVAAQDETEVAVELIPAPAIQKRILVVRERHVMLDEDLAGLYGVETRRLIEQVKRNIERFPADFMFQLSKEETAALRSQTATSGTGEVAAATPPTYSPSRESRCSRRAAKQAGGGSKHRDHACLRRATSSGGFVRCDREETKSSSERPRPSSASTTSSSVRSSRPFDS
jgi:hypothetical protein